MEELNLRGAKIEIGSLPSLSQCTGLRHLDLAATDIEDDDLKAVSRITSFEELDLSKTAISDDEIASLQSLPHLKTLYLESTEITDAGFQALVDQCDALKRIGVARSSISEEAITRVRKARRDLRIEENFYHLSSAGSVL